MGVIVKQSIKGTIVNYIGAFIGFLTTFFIITEFLTEKEIGLTSVLLAAATLLSGLSLMGTNSSVIRFYPNFKNPDNKDNGYFFWAIIIPFLGFIIFITLNYIFKDKICNYFIEQSSLFVDYFYLVAPLTFFVLYMSIFETYSTVLMKIVFPKLVREVILRIFLLINYLLYAFKILDFNGFIYVFCLCYAAAALVNLWYLIKLNKISLKPNLSSITSAIKKDYIRYTFYSLIISFGSVFSPLLSTFFISGELGLKFTGIFTIATYIAVIVEIPYRSLIAISQPQLAQNIKDNNINACNILCKNVSLHQLIIGSFLLFILWINIDLVFQIIPNGAKYDSGKYVVLILGLSKLVSSVAGFGVSALNYSKYFLYSIIFTIIITISAILFNIYFIPLLGIDGSALATLLSNILYFILLLIFLNYKTKINLFYIAHLKVLAIIILLLAINYIFEICITTSESFILSIIVAVIKTGLLCILGVIILYYWKISSNVNEIIDTVLNKIINKKI